ncbi:MULTISPECIES: RNA polymerase sigma factor [Alcaligenaceae]|uniref:ECF sigma factor n=1 Tax=Bordetella ansorpii TaxID=288768 RepID=A0A157SAU7_9BORD|nr:MULTISPECIES: sigma-70 family RNA polymerase sigma factor [Alcaligenaceae]BEG76397.1 putative RNA polymerase sigma factor FecI [Achromobacter xylosoxidans]SAI67548.1 ECF sigma factor [Bordetella ansorpii]
MRDEASPSLIDYLTRHYGTLKQRVSRLLGGNSELANDALHDAWLRLAAKDVDKPIQSPGSYLVRMAVNLAVDVQRRQGRMVSLEEINDAMDLSDPEPGPPQVVEARLELEYLTELVERLPRRRRAIFVMVHWEGVTRAEVALRLGCSKRTVESELKHAHDALAAGMRR